MKRKSPLEREWERLCRKEAALDRAAGRAVSPAWKAGLEARVPEKALKGLESAFAKGFSLVFQHGAGIIGKTCGTEKLRQQHDALHRAALATGSRRDLRRLPAASRTAQLGSLALTTAEGAALGLLGVGMPDILLFLGVLLRGICETALRFGFDWESPREQLIILSMMETAVSRGEERLACSAGLQCLLTSKRTPSEEELKAQMQKTGAAFASGMLFAKFVQGLPVVGVAGGLMNPVFYRRVMQVVQLQYQKRWLRQLAGQKGVFLQNRQL